MIFDENPAAIVRSVEEESLSDQKAIDLGIDGNAKTKLGMILVGKGCHFWRLNDPTRNDSHYAELVGIDQSYVNAARRAYIRFWDARPNEELKDPFPNLTWRHIRVALPYDNAEELLHWANVNKASSNEMIAWKRIADRFPMHYRLELMLPDKFFVAAINWDNAEAWLEWARDSEADLETLIQKREETYAAHAAEQAEEESSETENPETEDAATEDASTGEDSTNSGLSQNVQRFLSDEARKTPNPVLRELKEMGTTARRLKKEVENLAESDFGIYVDLKEVDKIRKQIAKTVDRLKDELESSFEFVVCDNCSGSGCDYCSGNGVILQKMVATEEDDAA